MKEGRVIKTAELVCENEKNKQEEKERKKTAAFSSGVRDHPWLAHL